MHWKAIEAARLIRLLNDGGWTVEYDEVFETSLMKNWRQSPPDLFVIDLSRLPSHGREIAIALRQSPKTRSVPIVFCNGAEQKVALIRSVLPDATYCADANLLAAVRHLRPLSDPVKPKDMMNRYGARTTAQKLGIRDGSRIALFHAPGNCTKILGPLPAGAEFVDQAGDVTLCFLAENADVRADISRLRGMAATTKLWFLWRKKSAGGAAGVTETLIREIAIELGLVDYKVCSVDPSWSAMLFAQRKDPAVRA